MMRAVSRSGLARGFIIVVLAAAGCGSASKPSGEDGGGGVSGQAGAGGSLGGGGTGAGGKGGAGGQGGDDGGAAGAKGRGGADGGAAGTMGGGGAGGATQPACTQNGGLCPGDCASPCPGGTTAVTLACPFVPSNAACGAMHCCLPTTSYACGSDTCMTGQTFCYSFAGGVPGAGTSRSCMTVPAACAKNPTCACLCPPATSGAFGCNFAGGFSSASCNCSEGNGQVTVSCAGA